MRRHISRTAGFAAAALLLAAAGTAQAQGKGHGKGHDENEHAQMRNDHDRDRDHEHDGRYDDRRGYDHHYDQSRQSIPPGLARKPGAMPPGQYRKLYNAGQGASVLSDVLGRHGYRVVRTADAGDSRYVYYRDRAGAVHRATVTPTSDRLRFTSVPRTLLDEVMSRLH